MVDRRFTLIPIINERHSLFHDNETTSSSFATNTTRTRNKCIPSLPSTNTILQEFSVAILSPVLNVTKTLEGIDGTIPLTRIGIILNSKLQIRQKHLNLHSTNFPEPRHSQPTHLSLIHRTRKKKYPPALPRRALSPLPERIRAGTIAR